MSKYHFFWSGVFSNWYPCQFEIGGVKYSSTEQHMMAKKARLFGDLLAESMIMATDDPSEAKSLGRQVKGFDVEAWSKVARDIVYEGNLAKFSQNQKLKGQLLATYPKQMVEASPEDVIWGIGLRKSDPRALDKSKWRGTNWLGEVLDKVRESLMKNE